jgi:hypothetical protein
MWKCVPLLILLSGGIAQAQPANALSHRTGNDILLGCQDVVANRETIPGVVCLTTVVATRMLAKYLVESMRSCPPVDATHGQVVRLATKYMEDHPDKLQEDHQALILLALREKWPCK